MIHYQLRCARTHEFDGWFRSAADFDAQAARGLLECPHCGEHQVERALMAPALPRKGNARVAAPAAPEPVADSAPNVVGSSIQGTNVPGSAPQTAVTPGALPAEMRAALQRLRAEVEKNCDYVGNEFADEARKMHRGESDRRGIYGETTPDQAEALADEGIEVARVPWVPRSDG